MGVKALGYVIVETAQPERWDAFLTELAGVMALLRVDALSAQAEQLAQRVQAGDTAALEDYKRVNERLKALKTGSLV